MEQTAIISETGEILNAAELTPDVLRMLENVPAQQYEIKIPTSGMPDCSGIPPEVLRRLHVGSGNSRRPCAHQLGNNAGKPDPRFGEQSSKKKSNPG